ncbi:SCP-like protein [Ancylostoma caninum]|uniref:SCP-like protein n=1 Tax=Ancylostoma caninum TaxID=29170 RepID=A0A368FPB0_ANCCA|nr:SCP-like protein [Ancylostoma caninum]
MRLSVVLAVFVAGSFAQAPGYYQCWNFGQTNEIRHIYLSEVNKLRQPIGEGKAPNKDGMCPQGKNIYKLFWDCILENYAQEAVDKCGAKPTVPAELSMVWNETTLTTCNPTPSFKKQVNDWWDEVKRVGLGTDAAFKPGLENFAVLANGLATRIGCAQKNCNGKLQMACVVYGNSNNHGSHFYPTTILMLCSKKFLDNICPHSPPDANKDLAREELLKVHNEKRAAIAKGEVKMGNGKMARRCPRMKKFVRYNCTLEVAAYEKAKTCPTADPNIENVSCFLSNARNKKLAAREAMDAWFGEISKSNAHMEQATGSQNLLLPALNIRQFARMVWDRNAEMGCGIAECKGSHKYVVVCQYGQGVGKYGDTIYMMGPTCNQCGGPSGGRCTDGAFCP